MLLRLHLTIKGAVGVGCQLLARDGQGLAERRFDVQPAWASLIALLSQFVACRFGIAKVACLLIVTFDITPSLSSNIRCACRTKRPTLL